MTMQELIIHDGNFHEYTGIHDSVHGRGLIPRDFDKTPFCSLPFTAVVDFPSIPQGEWSARIKAMEESKTRLSDVIRRVKMPSLNQGSTNFCWANGPVNCIRVIRAVNNLPFIDLSPASVACPINGFRNEGGWGTRALKQIVDEGIVPASMWPANAIDRQYDNEATREMRKNFKCLEWYDLIPRNFGQLITLLMLRIPVAVGYNWWRHEVTAIDPVEISPGNFGVRIWNSWGDDWPSQGAGGMSVLAQSKATPDDAVAPRSAVAFS